MTTQLPRVQITSIEDRLYRLLIDGHDMSMIAERVDISINAASPAIVNIWVPASLAVDIPANLVIFVDYPNEKPNDEPNLCECAGGMILVHDAFPAVFAAYPERRDPGVQGYVATNDCADMGRHFVLVRRGQPDVLVAVADCAQERHVAWRQANRFIADVDKALWVGPWIPQRAELWTVDARDWWAEQEWMH